MARILLPPLPSEWDVVRCYLEYPHDQRSDRTHPALVLKVVPPGSIGNVNAIVVVAGGTGTYESLNHRRRKIQRGEIPFNLELCKSAGLIKETKFCFSEEGVFAFPWDSEFFRWDAANPTLLGEPIFGRLNIKGTAFERFRDLFLASPELKALPSVINNAVRLSVISSFDIRSSTRP